MTTTGVVESQTIREYNPLVANLYGGLFALLGLMALGLLYAMATGNPVIQSVMDWTATDADSVRPSIILAFLSELGIVLPGLLLVAGGSFVSLGWRLRSGNILAARWAQLFLLWLSIGGVLLAVLNFYRTLRRLRADEAPIFPAILQPTLLPLLAAALLFIIWFWLNRNLRDAFRGQEPLNAQQTRFAWNLLIPSLVIFVFVAARPLEQTFIRSLTDKRFGSGDVPSFVGFQNYANLLNMRLDTVSCRLDDDTGTCRVRDDGSIRWESIDRNFLEAGYRTSWIIPLPAAGDVRQAIALSGLDDDFLEGLGTTIVFAVSSVTLELIIGLFVALVVNSKFAGRGFMRAVMLIPWAIPTVVSARLWELMLKDTSAGIFNRVLMDVGWIDAPQAWLSAPALQLPAAIMVDVWKTSPFMALLLLAGLQTIPKSLYEAASVDGASRLRRFFAVTLPLLRPTIAVALVFRMLDALRMFDLFNVLFGRQQLSLATYNYEVLVNNQRDGYASAVSIIIFLLIGAFAVLYVRILNVETD
jgi:trehalose/maltose transport system permease protein